MSLRKKTISGLFWSALSQGGKQLSQFVITVVLVRLLSPKDFGLLAMASIFTGFAMIFGEAGISSALIQRRDVKDIHWSSAFWLNLIVGGALALLFVFVAPLIALFYKKPELTSVLRVLSLNFILSSLTIVQQTILTREMNFRSLMIRDTIAVMFAGLVGILLAFKGWGVWSLVAQTLAFSVANGLLLWFLSTWRPRFVFSMEAIKDIFHFSANMTGFQIINYFARNIDQLLIGKFLGSQALGYYSLAYKLMLLPLQNISWTISKVMFPAFSRIQDDLEKVRINYLKLMKASSLISFPLMVGLLTLAPELVRVFWGEKWEPVVVLIQIFCFCGMMQSIGTNVGNIMQSQGKADLQLKLQILGAVIVVISILIGLNWGITGAALCYTLQSAFWVHGTFGIVNRLIGLADDLFYRNLIKSYLVALIMLVSGLTMKRCLIMSDIQYLVVMPIFYGLVFLCSMVVVKEIKFNNGKLSVGLMQ